MANHYLMKYKGTYRILPELDKETHDFPRNALGEIEETYDDIYITCHHGSKIFCYGKDGTRIALMAYIPSLIIGRRIKKAMDEQDIPYTNYMETDEEITFRFKPTNIEPIAELMKAKTSGANISPFSTKNLPKAKVEIPIEKLQEYKAIIADVQKSDLFIIKGITNDFLANILSKKYRKVDRKFSYKQDMRKMMMGRMSKEYIYSKEMFDDYLAYLKRRIKAFYKDKNK